MGSDAGNEVLACGSPAVIGGPLKRMPEGFGRELKCHDVKILYLNVLGQALDRVVAPVV